MALRREINDHIRLFFFEDLIDPFSVADILFVEGKVGIVFYTFEVFKVARISQRIQADDLIFGMCLHGVDDVIASDESGAAGNDKFHDRSPLLSCSFVSPQRLPVFSSRWSMKY